MRCSSGSSPRSPSPSSDGSIARWSEARRRSTPTRIATLFAVLATGFASGCGSRTVFVPEASPMRVGPFARMRVYHMVGGEWMLSNNQIAVPEGWYLVPPQFVDGKESEDAD